VLKLEIRPYIIRRKQFCETGEDQGFDFFILLDAISSSAWCVTHAAREAYARIAAPTPPAHSPWNAILWRFRICQIFDELPSVVTPVVQAVQNTNLPRFERAPRPNPNLVWLICRTHAAAATCIRGAMVLQGRGYAGCWHENPSDQVAVGMASGVVHALRFPSVAANNFRACSVVYRS